MNTCPYLRLTAEKIGQITSTHLCLQPSCTTMADNSRPTAVYPSPQYQTQSPVRSWATPQQGWAPNIQPPTGSEVQFWQGQPDYRDRSAPADYAHHGGYTRPPSEVSERETVSDATLLEQSEYGHPPKSATNSQTSNFYTDSNSDHSTLVHPQLYSPPAALATTLPAYVHPGRADDYLAQRPPTPSPSNPSWDTYIHRLKKFTAKVKSLPWMPRERITVDYYPGASKLSQREHQHRLTMSWRNPEAYPTGYHSDEMDSSTDDVSAMPRPLSTGTNLDLGDEFTDSSEPSPQQPPSQRLSMEPPGFDNPVPAGYPIQRPQSTPWYSATQQPLFQQVYPQQPVIPLSIPFYQPIPQTASQPNTPMHGFIPGQPMVATFPGGYVPAGQQHLGYSYGQPVHR
ncbi:hypothetical protein BKA70DRAFT_1271635 [Coprinopsis sp. MPI-PUGE-AT-0042]|nr:hypothetical protein BKA70DRAFT_1271635 [Coprinopsis sp. MPI-PUGE-AT-0042]